MKASMVGKEGNIAKITVEFSAEEFEGALMESYKKNKGQFRIDGFRPGKAPRKLIEQHYGKEVFDEDALDYLLGKEYPNALMELGIEPIDRPEADIPALVHGEGFTATFSVPTPPEVDVKDYEGVETEAKSYPVSDEDVDRQLEQARARNARYVETDRAIEDGDIADIDYEGSIDGVPFDGGKGEGHQLTIGSGAFIDGFEQQLVGRKAGDEADVEVTFPDGYHAEQLAGKPAVFHVKINAVKYEEKPELCDEFAQDISEFDTLEELRADIRAKMEEQAKQRAEMEMKDAILEKIYEANDIEVPEVMVDDQLEEMLKEFESNIKQNGFKLEQYFQMTGQAPRELRERIKEEAYKRVKMRLIVAGIARQQGFSAAPEEVDGELAKMAEAYGIEDGKIKEVLGAFQVRMLANDIKHKKAVDYVYENAVAIEPDPMAVKVAPLGDGGEGRAFGRRR